MAAPKIQPTREEWEARALELAEARHLTGTAQYVSEGEQGHTWKVPSRSHDGASYAVLARLDGRIECPCTAGTYGRPCGHAGAVLDAERMRKEAIQAAARDGPTGSEGWRWWMHGGEG